MQKSGICAFPALRHQLCFPMTGLKTSIKTITYLSDIGYLDIQGGHKRKLEIEKSLHDIAEINGGLHNRQLYTGELICSRVDDVDSSFSVIKSVHSYSSNRTDREKCSSLFYLH